MLRFKNSDNTPKTVIAIINEDAFISNEKAILVTPIKLKNSGDNKCGKIQLLRYLNQFIIKSKFNQSCCVGYF